MRTVALAAVVAFLALGAGEVITRGTPLEARLIGGALLLIGFTLMIVARRQLGNAFAVTPQAKELVTRGLYAKIPHPMYVFLDLTLLGVVVMVRQAWLLVIPAVLLITQTWQAHREAKVLEGAFGDAYREYRGHTWW